MPDELQQFVMNHHVKKIDKGKTIIKQGSKPSKVYVVRKGVVQSRVQLINGTAQTVSFNIPGDLFPLSWTFKARKTSAYTYFSLTDCELYIIPRRTFHKHLLKQPEHVQTMLGYFARRYDLYQRQITALAQQKATSKLAHFLFILAKQFGSGSVSKRFTHLDIPLTQTLLGDLTGLSRETIAKSLTVLRQTKAIYYERGNYLIDQKKLKKIIIANNL